MTVKSCKRGTMVTWQCGQLQSDVGSLASRNLGGSRVGRSGDCVPRVNWEWSRHQWDSEKPGFLLWCWKDVNLPKFRSTTCQTPIAPWDHLGTWTAPCLCLCWAPIGLGVLCNKHHIYWIHLSPTALHSNCLGVCSVEFKVDMTHLAWLLEMSASFMGRGLAMGPRLTEFTIFLDRLRFTALAILCSLY